MRLGGFGRLAAIGVLVGEKEVGGRHTDGRSRVARCSVR